MKAGILRVLAAVTTAVLLSGCDIVFGSDGGSYPEQMKKAAAEGDAESVKRIAEEYSSENPDSRKVYFYAGKYCAEAGDIDSAIEYYSLGLKRDPGNTEAVSAYIRLLWEAGMLDAVKDGFPADDELMFRGRPLGEYDGSELRQMTSKPDQISYRKPEHILDTSDLSYDADEELVMPYGIEPAMGHGQVLAAIGFTEEQAALISDVSIIAVDITDGFSAEAKKSEYVPFSQHPEEEWELSVTKGSVTLRFNGCERLSRYTVDILF